MSYRGFFVRLKSQLFHLSFNHWRCWRSIVYLLDFHYADELGITEVDMNSRGFCLEINLSRGVLFGSHLVTTLWYECENNRKVLQRCIMDLIQSVWLDKLSDKLIGSSMRVDRWPHLYMNVDTMEKFWKDTSRAFFNEFDFIRHYINLFNPSSEQVEHHNLIWIWIQWKSSAKMRYKPSSMSFAW